MSKRLTENEAKKKVIERCKEVSTNDETITFLGWKDNKYKNKRTYLVLHNSKINYIWDTTTFSSFLINKITRPNSFSQEYYINKIKETCSNISTKDEVISFYGWKDNIFKGNKTKLILHNSKFDIIWDTTDYTTFITLGVKQPQYLTEDNARKLILNKCNEISTETESILFLGWKDGIFLGSNTLLVLYNSMIDLIWKTTSLTNFLGKNSEHKYPKFSLIPKDKRTLVFKNRKWDTKTLLKQINIFYSDKNWDLSKVKYTGYHEKVCIICNEKDKLTGEKHGEFFVEAYKLLNGSISNCPKCSGSYRYTTDDFIKRSRIITEGKYTYEKTEYKSNKIPVTLTCPIHGDFLVRPQDHFRYLIGCPECNEIHKGEKVITEYLNSKNIFHNHLYKLNSENLIDCPNKDYVEIDYYLEHNGRKIFIEFNGQQHYKFVYLFHKDISNFHRQLLRDLSVVNYARDNEIELLEIPYCDLSRVPEILDAFLEKSENITTYVPRDLLSGPSLPLGLPLLD